MKKILALALILLPTPLMVLSSHFYGFPPEEGKITDGIQWLAAIIAVIPTFSGIVWLAFLLTPKQ